MNNPFQYNGRGEQNPKYAEGLIQKCTVRVTPERVGKFWVNQYSHADLEMLELAVNRAMDRIPKEFEPVSSCPQFIIGEWHSSVSYLHEVKHVQNG